MKYKFKLTQSIDKLVEVDAESQDEAFDKIEAMVGEGDIRFDEEPYMPMDCNITPL